MNFVDAIEKTKVVPPPTIEVNGEIHDLKKVVKVLGIKGGLDLDNTQESIVAVAEVIREKIIASVGVEDNESLELMTSVARGLYQTILTIEIQQQKGNFSIPDLEFEHDNYKICPSCKGLSGFLTRDQKMITVPCKACEDPENHRPTGQKFVKCRNCKGTGVKNSIFGMVHTEGPCPKCVDPDTGKSTGYVLIQCPACKGTKKYKQIIATRVESMNLCHTCGGVGIVKKDFKPKINPKKPLSSPMGEKLQKAMNEQKELVNASAEEDTIIEVPESKEDTKEKTEEVEA